jgi:hypothetical protein
MQAEGQQADNANAREYVDVVSGLHMSPPFFHRQLSVYHVGGRVKDPPLASQPVDHGDNV